MKIKRLKRAKFGTDRIARVVTGYALYEEGKGYIAFSSDRDEFGILAPYIPCGGKRALQSLKQRRRLRAFVESMAGSG